MPDSKVEVKACPWCQQQPIKRTDSYIPDAVACPNGHTAPMRLSEWNNRPIANNGVSVDSIVDKLTHLNGDHLMGLELNDIHIIANFITRLQTTAPLLSVVKKAVESGLIVVKPCEGCGSNGWYVGHRSECSLNREECCDCGGEQIQCETCSGNGFTITEGEVSGG